jgi:hypothetical protein
MTKSGFIRSATVKHNNRDKGKPVERRGRTTTGLKPRATTAGSPKVILNYAFGKYAPKAFFLRGSAVCQE